MDEESDRRSHILEVAARLFAHRGYGSTSVREVVEAAGVTKPTLYYYFDSKEALFREVVAWKLAQGSTTMADAVGGGGSAVDILRRIIKAWLVGAAADPDGTRLILTCGLPKADGPQVDVMARHLKTLEPLEALVAQGQAEGTLRRDIEPRSAVLALMGSVHLQLMALVMGHPFDEAFVDTLLDIWLHGVSA